MMPQRVGPMLTTTDCSRPIHNKGWAILRQWLVCRCFWNLQRGMRVSNGHGRAHGLSQIAAWPRSPLTQLDGGFVETSRALGDAQRQHRHQQIPPVRDRAWRPISTIQPTRANHQCPRRVGSAATGGRCGSSTLRSWQNCSMLYDATIYK